MYAPQQRAQHPCDRVLSVACPAFLTKLRRIKGSGKVPPRLGLRPQRMWAELTRLELPIFDCRLLIDRGRKLPHDFFNRQAGIGNENRWWVNLM
jgi:hypothetical protein